MELRDRIVKVIASNLDINEEQVVPESLDLLAEVGFTATVRPLEYSAVPPGSTAIFAAHKFRTPRRLTMAG